MIVDYDKFAMTGINVQGENSISPPGNYLRWSFSSELGLPNVEIDQEKGNKEKEKKVSGIYLYRRDNRVRGFNTTLEIRNFIGDPGFSAGSGRKEIAIEKLTISSDDPLKLTYFGLLTTSEHTSTISIKFAEPVFQANVYVVGKNKTKIAKAFMGENLVSNDLQIKEIFTDSDTPVYYFQLKNTLFDKFLIPLDGQCLINKIEYSTVASDCEVKKNDWELIYTTFFPNPEVLDLAEENLQNELFERLPKDFRNRYFKNGEKERYKDRIKLALGWLSQLFFMDESFVDPSSLSEISGLLTEEDQSFYRDALLLYQRRSQALHERTQFFEAKDNEEGPRLSLKPLNEILRSTIDPNIAYMMGLMYVDTEAQTEKSYDYMVCATWGLETYHAILYSLGGEPSNPVPIPDTLVYEILKGTTWQEGTAKKRVGLNWETNLNSAVSPEHPVLYDLCRNCEIKDSGEVIANGGEFITEKNPGDFQPILCPKEHRYCYIDPLVSTGTHEYHVRGIDLFGRVSGWRTSGKFDVLDAFVPPPPVMVKAELDQPGYPWLKEEERANPDPNKLTVSWEWRYFQYRQCPAVKYFSVYYHREPLVESIEVDVTTVKVLEQDEARVEVSLVIPAGNTIDERFTGGTLSKLNNDGKLPEVKNRVNFQLSGSPEDIGKNTIVVVRSPTKIGNKLSYEFRKRASATWQSPLSSDRSGADAGLSSPPSTGKYMLHSNPRNHKSWVKISDIFRISPLAGTVKNVKPLDVNIIAAENAVDRNGADILYDQGEKVYRIKINNPLEADAKAVNILPGQMLQKDGNAWLVLPNLNEAFSNAQVRPSDHDLARALEITAPAVQADSTELMAVYFGEADKVPSAGEYQVPGIQEVDFEPKNYDDEITFAPGGQLAIPGAENRLLDDGFRHNKKSDYIGLDIISKINKVTGDLQFWVKVPRNKNDINSDYISFSTSRSENDSLIFPAYRQSIAPFSALDPGPGEAFKVGYIAVSSVSGNVSNSGTIETESSLSPAIQILALKRPSQVKPNAPYPKRKEGPGIESPEGYATPPDFHGKSFFSLEWNLPANTPEAEANQLKYEVYRALDRSIINADHRNWQLKQGHYAEVSYDAAGNEVVNAINFPDAVDNIVISKPPEVQDDQSILLETKPAIDESYAKRLNGGAFEFTDDNETVRYPILGMVRCGDIYLIRTRKRKRPVTLENSNTDFYSFPSKDNSISLLCPPDYTAIISDSGTLTKGNQSRLLRQMANLSGNEKAFDLVTKSPINKNMFTDVLPGKGRNRYYYRVRGLDITGNRTQLSDTSVPVFLVDTTPPAAPLAFQATPADRTAILSWSPPLDNSIAEYDLYRMEGCNEDFNIATASPYMVVPISDMAPKELCVIGGNISLPWPIESIVDGETIVSFESPDSTPGTTNLFIRPVDLTTLEDRRIRSVNLLIENGTVVNVTIGDENKHQILTHRPGRGERLRVVDGQIDLSFGLDVDDIALLLSASMVREDTHLEELLQLPNILNESGVTYSLTNLSITGLDTVLGDGSAVVVIVRLTDNSLYTIRHAPGTDKPLTVEEGQIRLDIDIGSKSLLCVNAVQNDPTVDLRLTSTSQVKRLDDKAYSIVQINPLVKDLTSVCITLKSSDGRTHTLNRDPSFLTWKDNGLQGGEKYYYYLAAVKYVMFPQPFSATNSNQLRICSTPAGPVFLLGIDHSVPSPPVIRGAEWIDRQSGAAASTDAAEPAIRISLHAPAETGKIRLQRRQNEQMPWSNVPLSGGRGWLNWQSRTTEFEILDENVDPSNPWSYRAQLRTSDDRTSPLSGEMRIGALKEGDL